MAEHVLTLRELNRATLARQLLLRRARLPVPRAIERLGGLQAQFPVSPYMALWSRLDGFRRDDLARALERRTVVKATLMRGTLHIVSAADYLAFAGVFTGARAASLARRLGRQDVDELAERAVALAAEPRSRQELLSLLGEQALRPENRPAWILWHLLTARAELVLTPESAAWRKTTGRARFVTARAWFGRGGNDGTAAVEHLLRRYLAAFGPASVADAVQWSGLPARTLREALDRLDLRAFEDERGRELVDLPRAPRPSAATPAPPRFLPMWDSVLLAHDDRTRVLPEEYRRTVIRRNAEVLPTFLVDGFVSGTWREESGRVRLEPFEPLPRRVLRELEQEAERVAAFHA